MKTTRREIEQQIGAVRCEIQEAARCLEAEDKVLENWACAHGGRELKGALAYSMERRRLVLMPLMVQLHGLEARVPEEVTTRPATIEALFCLLDHVHAEEARGATTGRPEAQSFTELWMNHLN